MRVLPHIAKKAAARWCGGFSLAELVIVAGLAALVFTTGALAFRTIAVHQNRTTSYQKIAIGKAIARGFYGLAEKHIDVYTAPNYGMNAQAEVMRNVFWEDVAKANAVFCLPRGPIAVNEDSDLTDVVVNLNTIHPPETPANGSNPAIPPGLNTTASGFELDHPNAFRELLLSLYPHSVSNPFPFKAYRGVPAAEDVNGSIYVLQLSSDVNRLVIRAVYDIDFLTIANPPGIYASVKRYYGTVLTHSYDVLYEGAHQSVTDFGPLFACFERKIRQAVVESTAINAFKRAGNRPFYFIWWPDPANPRLLAQPTGGVGQITATSPKYYYLKHENQTAWMFTVPIFPAL